MVIPVGNDNMFLPNVVGKMRFPFNSWSVIDGWMILTFTSMTFLRVKPDYWNLWDSCFGQFLAFYHGTHRQIGEI